jgi:predicted 2-oxoglutarate/Fe(II)-dependent dioxygenase YbiX
MLKISKDILDNKTHKELQKICEDFDNRDFENVNQKYSNHYLRLFIKNEILIDYINNAQKYLIENLGYDKIKMIDFETTNSWINKVSIETNKNDDFHFDFSGLTLVTYLNNEFIGGEFIYIDEIGKEQTIMPGKLMTLIMNDKLLHKVAPVNSGLRFSLVTFYELKRKKNRSLI